MRLRIALLAALLMGCKQAPMPATDDPGTPLAGLSEHEFARFHAGKALFNKIFTAEEGLGPAFNENQCSACHTVPAAGGTTGFERIVRATRYEGPGTCDLLSREGGENIRKQATPLLRSHGIVRESHPPSATESGRFLPTFLFGLGLIEAIPEATIAAAADPDDRNGDGISGRAARTPDGRLARFGRKGDVATIEEFTRSALRLEMGLTSDAEPDRVNGSAAPTGSDPVTEPEVDDETVALLTDFSRFLAPLAQAPPRSPDHADTLAAGRRLFENLGCTGCHTPAMRTGRHEVEALNRRTVQLYSDLLLHDMGPELANVCAHDASPTELRTAVLAGLQHRRFFLHDGRAFDLREAILAHGGEGASSRDSFERLPWLLQEYVIMFLQSL